MDILNNYLPPEIVAIIEEFVKHSIAEFDLRQIKPNTITFILGAPATGKTTLINRLLKYYNQRSQPIVYRSCSFKRYNCDKSYIYDTTNEAFKEGFLDLTNRIKERQERSIGDITLIIDDVIEEHDGILRCARLENIPIVQQTFMDARHWRTGIALASRFMLIQRHDLCAQLGYIFIFPSGIRGNANRTKSAHRFYVQDIVDLDTFAVMLSILSDHQVLVIDKIQRKIFYY